ncbi:MAG: hypothetical protein JWN03_1683 [Nocardia sp.]|uniref:hypothetical protein n=1 Tax=Nocardia sp. TaxID=1821 RepID=UPI002635C003|nr:hypothetical protein [Nocardia sp.]MCU1641408.1 hypothetical protein [Nocardia sp.]
MAGIMAVMLGVAAAALVPAGAATANYGPNYPDPGSGSLNSGCIMLCNPPPAANVLPERSWPGGCIMLCDNGSSWSIPLNQGPFEAPFGATS